MSLAEEGTLLPFSRFFTKFIAVSLVGRNDAFVGRDLQLS